MGREKRERDMGRRGERAEENGKTEVEGRKREGEGRGMWRER